MPRKVKKIKKPVTAETQKKLAEFRQAFTTGKRVKKKKPK